MPEFPEVYTIVTDLKKHLEGLTISEVKLFDNYKVKYDEGLNDLEYVVHNKKINSINQYGKYIFMELDNVTVVIHLGMTGKLIIRSPVFNHDKHIRVIFVLTKKDVTLELRFIDVRMFGKVLILTKSSAQKLINKLGPNPLSETLSTENFHAIIKSKKTSIKNVLMDQEKISGMGNVYVTDALWIAKLHPLRPTSSLTKEETGKLLIACREILSEGIKNRGLTISDYVDAFGKPGFQQNFFRIYRHENCTLCGTKTSVTTINARATYFCSTCQK
jgi:formamidopyrimidine-DNA glycosylase